VFVAPVLLAGRKDLPSSLYLTYIMSDSESKYDHNRLNTISGMPEMLAEVSCFKG